MAPPQSGRGKLPPSGEDIGAVLQRFENWSAQAKTSHTKVRVAAGMQPAQAARTAGKPLPAKSANKRLNKVQAAATTKNVPAPRPATFKAALAAQMEKRGTPAPPANATPLKISEDVTLSIRMTADDRDRIKVCAKRAKLAPGAYLSRCVAEVEQLRAEVLKLQQAQVLAHPPATADNSKSNWLERLKHNLFAQPKSPTAEDSGPTRD